MKIISVISYPRTGSSLLLEMIGCYKITALLEIFHANPLVAKKHLARDPLLQSTPGFIEGYTREVAARDPVALIDTITQIKSESNALMFKIFPGHLPAQAMAQVIAKSDILLIHSRNRIHSFISDVIATRLGSWARTATDTHYVDFCSRSFIFYSRHVHDFLTSAISLAIDSSTPIAFSNYEMLIEPSSRKSAANAISAMLLGSKHVATSSSGRLPRRQDNRLLASQKVTNPDQLLDFLGQRNLLALDRGTFDIKFSQYASLE
jgi:hypothetical protein